MTDNLKNVSIAFFRCYFTTQVVGLLVFVLIPCLSLLTGFADAAALAQVLFVGLIITAIPTLVFSGAMTLITKRICSRNEAWYSNYLWSVGVTLFIFFGLFPFFSTFHPPARWLHRFPSREELVLLGEAIVAGLAGTAVVRRFWKARIPAARCEGVAR
ncbi:MAG: hypothetical protein WCN95_14645 [bacterium]